ncbi:MAG: hypothetical protein Q7U99_13060 [Rubrivivax sp.]|nr:hypothetical protein [Rubrivivax sp.]
MPMTTERVLKQALQRNFGPAFDPAAVPEEARFIFEHPQLIAEEALAAAQVSGTASRRAPYRLLAGLYDSPRVNAGTLDLDPATSVVAISSRLPPALLHAVAVVTDQADAVTLMPRRDKAGRLVVGGPRRALTARRSGGPGLEVARTLAALQRSGDLKLAMLVYDLAIRFVVMHECMHIVMGHTGYVRRELGLSVLMEMGASRRNVLTTELSLALEFIADRHAVRGVAQWARSGRLGDNVESIPRDPSLSQSDFLHRALILALMTLLRLFPARASLSAAAGGSHPHPYARMRWLARELSEDLDGHAEVVRLILEPMAYWNASFERNFVSPGRWSAAMAEDQRVAADVPPVTDQSYVLITGHAKLWQTLLWSQYSPLFPGDGRDESGWGEPDRGRQA